jgi:hypothetical protein
MNESKLNRESNDILDEDIEQTQTRGQKHLKRTYFILRDETPVYFRIYSGSPFGRMPQARYARLTGAAIHPAGARPRNVLLLSPETLEYTNTLQDLR